MQSKHLIYPSFDLYHELFIVCSGGLKHDDVMKLMLLMLLLVLLLLEHACLLIIVSFAINCLQRHVRYLILRFIENFRSDRTSSLETLLISIFKRSIFYKSSSIRY